MPSRTERCFVPIPRINRNLPVPSLTIQRGEVIRAGERRKTVFRVGKRIRIRQRFEIQQLVIDAETDTTILLPGQHHWATPRSRAFGDYPCLNQLVFFLLYQLLLLWVQSPRRTLCGRDDPVSIRCGGTFAMAGLPALSNEKAQLLLRHISLTCSFCSGDTS